MHKKLGNIPFEKKGRNKIEFWSICSPFLEFWPSLRHTPIIQESENIWTQSKIAALALTAGKSPKMIFWDILTKKPYSGMKLSRNDYWRVRNGMKQVLFNNNSKKAQKWCNVTFLTIFIPILTIYSFFKKFSHFFPSLGIPWPP